MQSRRDYEPGRLAAGHPARRACRRRRRPALGPASASASSSSREEAPSGGRRTSGQTGSSCIPSRSRGRSNAAEAARDSFRVYAAAAELAHSLGLGVNAGHDLDLENLVLFRTLPHLEEVSIGHALISHALFVGLDRSVREYLSVLRGA